jgi:hypothetical protein
VLQELCGTSVELNPMSASSPKVTATVLESGGWGLRSTRFALLLAMDWDHVWKDSKSLAGLTVGPTSKLYIRSRMLTGVVGRGDERDDGELRDAVGEEVEIVESNLANVSTDFAGALFNRHYDLKNMGWGTAEITAVTDKPPGSPGLITYTEGRDYGAESVRFGGTYLTIPATSRISHYQKVYVSYKYAWPGLGLATFSRLTNFSLSLPPTDPFITIRFRSLDFATSHGRNPVIDARIGDVEFAGALKFIQELKEYLLVLDGGGVKLAMGVERASVYASITITMPSIVVGPFALMNVTFMAKVIVPLDGKPVSLVFAFSSRQNPFQLSIMGLTGKGFLLLELDAGGLKQFEASLEFGASMPLSLPAKIATGSVSATGGVYFKWVAGEGMTFMAFFKVEGSMKIVGLITVSVCFMVELGYRSKDWTDGGKVPALGRETLYGKATLSVSIKLYLFKKNITLTLERSINGSDPTFGDAMPTQEDWNSYVDALCPIPIGKGGV